MIDLNKRLSKDDYVYFASFLKDISDKIGFELSARGWAYQLEIERLINKDSFDKVTNIINKCRKEGLLPIDFVAEEDARAFKGVETPDRYNVIVDSAGWLTGFLDSADHYTPDWWQDEDYYIQMVVEKVDLVTLFKPVCEEYHIPIANSRGWSSMLQRAEYAKRFQKAKEDGLKCVLLYCGDFDPDGLRISEFLRKNLEDLKYISWSDGMPGYDTEELIIDRFGLNYDFIIDHNLTWIDNLITGRKLDLASPTHKNHFLPYIQSYLKKYGAQKVEANAVITMPNEAKKLVNDAITKYLGVDAIDRFKLKRQAVYDEFNTFLKDTGLEKPINLALKTIENY